MATTTIRARQSARLAPSLRRHTNANRKRILAREAETARQITAQYQALQRHLKAAQSALVAAYAAEQQRLLDDALAEAEANDEDPEDVLASPPRVPPSWLTQSGQWQRYERVMLPAMAAFALYARMQITEGQRQAVNAGSSDAQALIGQALAPILAQLNLSFAVGLGQHTPPMAALEALIGRSLAADKPLAALLDTLGPYTAQKTLAALQAALTGGWHPTQAARLISDTTDMAYRRALTISRTELITAYRTATVENFRANSDVLSGWRWLTAADPCPFCASMADTIHDLDEYLDSHPNCRCTPSPVTKSLSDILALFAA